MTDPAHASAFDEASRIIRRFAHETNLLVAGRPVRIIGADAVAESLRTIASALGAQAVPDGDESVSADVVEIDTHYAPALISLGGEPLTSRGTAAGRVDFAGAHMPVTRALAAELAAAEIVSGLSVGVCLTLEPKTAQLALHLAAAGAEVAVYAHPDEIDPEVASVLRERGIPVDGDVSLSGEEEREAALGFLRRGFDVLVDDGSHLVRLAHQDAPDEVARWIGVSEETTSGLTPLREMSAAGILQTPVIAVNDAATKTGFDNRYGTGQSCVFAIADLLDAAQVNIRERPALVIGYGPVGVGVAAHLRALGVDVRVAEADPVRALLAQHDGYRVGRAADLGAGALVVSATGVAGTIPAPLLRDAFAVAVAGGVPGEIALDETLHTDQLEPVSRDIERLTTATTLVLDRGGCINVTAAEGNPIEIMDLSFATQLAAISELVSTRPETGVHALSDAAVAHVGAVAARERGLELDTPQATDVTTGDLTPGSADAAAAPSLGDAWHSRRFSIGRSAVPPSSQETP
ncbi:adenosylhomocysteinase [Demequina aurantiaca]|uniref:adenosylhomocysteinase n=1 Tax=Demequina aurantiaca TaxID=676200 RepID=UPI00078602B6|nr:adenosylhomocysteinase [Demequina aurantiaca]